MNPRQLSASDIDILARIALTVQKLAMPFWLAMDTVGEFGRPQ